MNIAQSLENLKLEQDAIVLYDALAGIEQDPRRADAFRHIADNERRHADIWARRLRELGASVPPAGRPAGPGPVHHRARPAPRDPRRVRPREGPRGRRGGVYGDQERTRTIEAIAADEREHAEIWKRLDDERPTGAAGPAPDGGDRRRGRATHPAVVVGEAESPDAITRARDGTAAPGRGPCARSSSG